jgi:hypothetical protein
VKQITKRKTTIAETDIENIFNSAEKEQHQRKPRPSSRLKLVYFDGCIRTKVSIYRQALKLKGFKQHLARDIEFLPGTKLQILTYEDEEDNLIRAMTNISSSIKHLPEYDPIDPANYGDEGNQVERAKVSDFYFNKIRECADRLTQAALLTPVLTRAAQFLHQVFQEKRICPTETASYEPTISRFFLC